LIVIPGVVYSFRFGGHPVANGKDLAADLAESRAAITVADLAARYLQDEVVPKRKPGTAQLYGHYLNRFVVPEIRRLKAASVTRATIAKLHVKIGKKHAVTANRVLATLSGMFAFGEKRGLLPAGHINPAKGIEKFPEAARERYLTSGELERLGAAIREAETTGVPWDIDGTKPVSKHLQKTGRLTVISPFAAAAIRLLLFTGCRLREILNLRWTEVDFELGMLNLADSKTGRKTVISTPLP
jgi:integrase